MNCKICSALFQEFLEKSLCEELITEVDRHIKTCHSCRSSIRTYSLTIVLSGKADPPCCVSSEKMDELKKILLERFFSKKTA
jgi:hypothetical protein